MTTTEPAGRLISQAVDCLTVVIEDDRETETVRRLCILARDAALNALIDRERDGKAAA